MCTNRNHERVHTLSQANQLKVQHFMNIWVAVQHFKTIMWRLQDGLDCSSPVLTDHMISRIWYAHHNRIIFQFLLLTFQKLAAVIIPFVSSSNYNQTFKNSPVPEMLKIAFLTQISNLILKVFICSVIFIDPAENRILCTSSTVQPKSNLDLIWRFGLTVRP